MEDAWRYRRRSSAGPSGSGPRRRRPSCTTADVATARSASPLSLAGACLALFHQPVCLGHIEASPDSTDPALGMIDGRILPRSNRACCRLIKPSVSENDGSGRAVLRGRTHYRTRPAAWAKRGEQRNSAARSYHGRVRSLGEAPLAPSVGRYLPQQPGDLWHQRSRPAAQRLHTAQISRIRVQGTVPKPVGVALEITGRSVELRCQRRNGRGAVGGIDHDLRVQYR